MVTYLESKIYYITKANLTFLTSLFVSLFYFTMQGQITISTRALNKQDSLEYLYHWDGNDITLWGYSPSFVQQDQNTRVPESGNSFTAPRTNDTFGYRITGVSDWDTDNAINAINNGVFLTYLSGLTPAQTNQHADFSGPKFGIGVDNLDEYGNRNDRVGGIGEALILTFDTAGNLEADNTPQFRDFVPEERSFVNTGLNSNTALRISNIHLEPGNVSPNNRYRRLDYLVYDASENTILSEEFSDYGMERAFRTSATSGTINRTWTIDDGDIIVLAYLPPAPEDEFFFDRESRLELYSWGLWSIKMDLVDNSTLSNDSSNTNLKTFLYPNPTSDEVNIQLDKIYNTVSVKLYSIDGRVLLSDNYSSKNKLSIDIENLKNGNYFLILNLDDNKTTLKVIKN